MKHALYLLLLCGCLNAAGQTVYFPPIIKHQLGEIKSAQLEKTVNEFYQHVDTFYVQNEHWSKSDYERLTYPTIYLLDLDRYKSDKNFFKPSVVSVSEIEKDKDYLLRVAYINRNDTSQSAISSIAYIAASYTQDSTFILKNPTDVLTRSWKTTKVGQINFHIQPDKVINMKEAQQADSFSHAIAGIFNVAAIPFDYYSCKDREQVYQVMGYDYKKDMYWSSGVSFGMTDYSAKRIYAANNSEYYPHEICHLYIPHLGSSKSYFVNEGIATLFGGSSGYPLEFHLKNLANYIAQNRQFSATMLAQKGEFMITKETNLTKALVGLIAKLVWESKGLQGLKELVCVEDDKLVSSFGKIVGAKNPDDYLINKALQYK